MADEALALPAPATARRSVRPSLAIQLVLLMVVFVTVPIVVYRELRAADEEKRVLVLASVQRQGQLIAQALEPVLQQPSSAVLPILGRELSRFASREAQVRVLLAPSSGPASGSFFYVAAVPETRPTALEAERDNLERAGVLRVIAQACEGGLPSALRSAGVGDQPEVVSSVTPIRGTAGCWAVVITHPAASPAGVALGRPYYESREMLVAAGTYLAMAVLILSMFLSLWHGLSRFARHARETSVHGAQGPSFEERNLVPELSGVAREFDRMVDRLRSSAAAIRRAAEDNLHAFKTPIAIIRQSIEPLQRLMPADSERGKRAVGLIEQALDRLDALVVQSKRLDEATADLIDAPLGDLDVSSTLERLLAGYEEMIRQRGLVLERRVEGGLVVHASPELFESAIENVLDNAIDFSPPGAHIAVSLVRRGNAAEVIVTDEGPGIDPVAQSRVFERYYSSRGTVMERGPNAHFGLGLSIVRRNVEVMGGSVGVQNAEPKGLRVAIRLPLAKAA